MINESVGAGLILSLINKYILGRNMFENCTNDQEETYDAEMVSVSIGISDSSTTHHVHV